ncbi:MAG: tetratricopeptide repeat protein, partial [Anaerolineales bacterium]|nr:tetratricopeptide repeat protein [Anaerolineales bacterium]
LRQWLDEDRAGLLRQRQLTEAAADWQALGRDPGALYRGTRLQQALAGGFPEPLSVLEQEFLDLSRANAERETAEAGQARWLRRNRWPLALVITVALAAAGLLAFNALQSLVPRAPGRMTGAFNIAVAQFAPAEGDAAAAGQRLSQWAAEQVAADLAGRSEFQVWYDTDQLKAEQNVVIGVVASADEAAQAAARLDADVLIYGVITPQAEGFAALDLRFFVAPQQQRDLGGVGGQYVLNAPLVFNLTDPGLDAAQAVGRQASGVVRLNLGLAYEVFGRSDEALSEFLTAADYLPDSASVQFLIGQEQLFQAQRAAGAAPADLAAAQALAGQARLALEAASRMDPALMRARIALGSQGAFTVQLALLQNPIPDDCQGSQAETYRPPLLDIERAIADYQAAAGAADDAGQPLAAIAQTGLAGAYRLQAAVQCGLGDPAAARAALEQGLAAAQASLPTLEQARDHRLLAQAYHTLGTLREYQAYLNQDDAALYRQALAAYEQCIQQGALAPTDEFLQREVVGQLCQPDRDRLQGLYGGGS